VTEIIIRYVDNVYILVECERSVAKELSDCFSFYAQNYQHHPKFKARVWDGKLKLFSLSTHLIYIGLLPKIEEFAKTRDYEIEYEGDFSDNNFSLVESQDFINSLKIPGKFELRDYQVKTFVHCIRKKRALFVSPTSSGKSLIIYFLVRYLKKRTLIIVPNTTLIHQMASDFESYGYTKDIQKIYSGQEKDIGADIVIATWQSAYKLSSEWFKNFEVIVGDEAHKFKAKSLTELMKKTPHIPYKFGFTGTLDGLEVNQMVLEGLFGQSKQIITTKELMNDGYISNLKIKTITLKHSIEDAKLLKKAKYQDEIAWLIQNKNRNDFLKNLTLSLNGNILVLYRYVENHGIPLYNLIKENAKDRKVYLIHGKIDSEERNEIRKIVDKEKNSIIVASLGCFSEGISIVNLHNIIFATPIKSRIAVLQSIGRGLRKGETKEKCTLFDFCDDLSSGKWYNHTLRHFTERMKYYLEEDFSVKNYKVKI